MLDNKLIKKNGLIMLTLAFSFTANVNAEEGSIELPSEAPSVSRPTARPGAGYNNQPRYNTQYRQQYRQPAPICASGYVFMSPAACCTPNYSVCENINTGMKTYGYY